jgi:hypothetical protein
MVNRPRSGAHVVFLLASVLAVDCKEAGVRPDVVDKYDPKTGRLYQLTYDSTSNGTADGGHTDER